LRDICRHIGKDPLLSAIAMDQWIKMAGRSKLKPVIEVTATVARHIAGVIRHFATGLTSVIIEGYSNAIQKVRARAYGFRSLGNSSA
jgi:transposase